MHVQQPRLASCGVSGVIMTEYLETKNGGTFYGNRYPVNPEYRDYSFWTEHVRPGFAVTKFLDDDVRVIDFQSDFKHACILLSNGKFKCAGREYIDFKSSNSYGKDYVNGPYIDLGTDEPVSQLAVGLQHTCALIGDRVKCFGDTNGYSSEFGGHQSIFGDDKGANLPYLDFGPGRTVKKIAANSQYTVALLNNGTASCFGSCRLFSTDQEPHEGIIDFGERKAIDVLAGSGSTCFVLDNKQMTCMGLNRRGELGLGTENYSVRADDFDNKNITYVNFGTGRSVKMAAKGKYHTCAILDNDKVKCFGSNTLGQLSIPTSKAKSLGGSPEEMGDNLHYIDLGEGRTAKSISTKYHATCVLLDNDQVKCWGPDWSSTTYSLRGVDSVFYKNNGTEPVGYIMGEELPYIYFVQPTKPLKPLSGEEIGGIVGGLFAACWLLYVVWLRWKNAARLKPNKSVGSNKSDEALKSDNPMFV